MHSLYKHLSNKLLRTISEFPSPLFVFSSPSAIIDAAPPQAGRRNCFSKGLVCLTEHSVIANTDELNVVTLCEPSLQLYQVYY